MSRRSKSLSLLAIAIRREKSACDKRDKKCVDESEHPFAYHHIEPPASHLRHATMTTAPSQWPIIVLGLWKTLVLVYDVLTLPVFLLLQRPWLVLQRASRVKAELVRRDDPYSPWVRVGVPDSKTKFLFQDVHNLGDFYRRVMKHQGTKKCYGYRQVLAEEEEKQPNGRVFRKLLLNDHYTWVTYQEADRQIEDLAAGFTAHGIRQGDRVVLFAETRPEWILTLHALLRIGATATTLYATLGDEGIVHAVNETSVSHIITSSDLLNKLAKLSTRTPHVKCLIYMEAPYKKTKPNLAMEPIEVLSFSQVVEAGKKGPAVPVPRVEADDTAIMMYTSGSTGTPKAVMISHSNVINAVKSVVETVMEDMDLSNKDVFLAYLPTAHIFELTCELSMIVLGIGTAYSSPQTMLNSATALKKGCKSDVSLVKPTVMPSVPLILDRIRKEVVNKMQNSNRLMKGIFEFSLDYKTYWTRKGFTTPLVNRFIFNKIKRMMGGELRFLLVGGAPLSPETQEFAANCLDVKVYQGYAATECTSTATVMDRYDLSFGRVGAPFYGVKLRLVDWREGGYFATDKPNPRGEILIAGGTITQGYFKREAETREVYSEEDGTRWWSTGDIGEMYPDGTLKIIDRKKDLVKLQHGEYISLGKVESALNFSDYVDNVCVFGDSFHMSVIALIVPNRKSLNGLAAELGKSNLTFAEICQDEDVIAVVRTALADHGLKSGLQRVELPSQIKLCPEEWLPDNGLVTASFKVRRRQIEDFYKQDIIRLYSSPSSSKST